MPDNGTYQEQSPDGLAAVLVVRCTVEAAVPSRVVVCSVCGADCWLSEYSGDQTLALAASMGIPFVICSECWEDRLAR